MPISRNTSRRLSAFLAAWLLAGTLDISSAFILFASRTGKSPLLILNYIASAFFGKEAAYSGGTPMLITGLLIHYGIAFVFTLLFFIAYRKIYTLLKNRIVAGLVYGLFIWLVMNLIAVPLTRIPARKISLGNAVENIIILMLAIGLPVSFIAYHYFYGDRKKSQ